jgi:NAD+ kinase
MAPRQLGLVVHPRRQIDEALGVIRDWAGRHGVEVRQVQIAGQSRQVAELTDAGSCDLLVSVGGDGTTLAALHAGAPVSRPVLGVACGSLGVLTSVHADDIGSALEHVADDRWIARRLPGLEVAVGGVEAQVAINDFTVIRDGAGQAITGIHVDGELYARTAGDGLVVATPLGSSAYTMAAGGPILSPTALGMVVTPLGHHGGVAPPLVVGPDSTVGVSVEPGHGGTRFERDGGELPMPAADVTLRFRREYATLVELAGQEPMLTGLRRRGLIVDSPRILARDARAP